MKKRRRPKRHAMKDAKVPKLKHLAEAKELRSYREVIRGQMVKVRVFAPVAIGP